MEIMFSSESPGKVRYEPLVIAVYQGPRFVIAGIQYRSTVISLYNKMPAKPQNMSTPAKPQNPQSDPIRRRIWGLSNPLLPSPRNPPLLNASCKSLKRMATSHKREKEGRGR